jgi:hypothetical protein
MLLFTLDNVTLLEYGSEQVFKMAAFDLDAVGLVLGMKCERVRRTLELFTWLAHFDLVDHVLKVSPHVKSHRQFRRKASLARPVEPGPAPLLKGRIFVPQ